jgi:hypothetical protein
MNCRKWEVVCNRVSKKVGLAVIKNYWIGFACSLLIPSLLPKSETQFEPPIHGAVESGGIDFLQILLSLLLLLPLVSVPLAYLDSRRKILNAEKCREKYLAK